MREACSLVWLALVGLFRSRASLKQRGARTWVTREWLQRFLVMGRCQSSGTPKLLRRWLGDRKKTLKQKLARSGSSWRCGGSWQPARAAISGHGGVESLRVASTPPEGYPYQMIA